MLELVNINAPLQDMFVVNMTKQDGKIAVLSVRKVNDERSAESGTLKAV